MGDAVGLLDGWDDFDGFEEGCVDSVGAAVGLFSMVGDSDGVDDRRSVGDFEGDDVGLVLMVAEGDIETVTVGDAVGDAVGVPVGVSVGDAVGAFVGDGVSGSGPGFTEPSAGAFVGGADVGDTCSAVVTGEGGDGVIHSGGSTFNNVDSQTLNRYTFSITFLDPGKKGIVAPSHSVPSASRLSSPKKWSQTDEAN